MTGAVDQDLFADLVALRQDLHRHPELSWEENRTKQCVRDFLDEQVAMAKEHGYVETLMGRRRYVPELRSSNWNMRQFGERVAQNTPIQGTAADLMKKAMIDVHHALVELGSGARVLLQVHDELLFEVPEAEVEATRDTVVACMEGAVELAVPLVADWGVGTSWYDCKFEKD